MPVTRRDMLSQGLRWAKVAIAKWQRGRVSDAVFQRELDTYRTLLLLEHRALPIAMAGEPAAHKVFRTWLRLPSSTQPNRKRAMTAQGVPARGWGVRNLVLHSHPCPRHTAPALKSTACVCECLQEVVERVESLAHEWREDRVQVVRCRVAVLPRFMLVFVYGYDVYDAGV